MTKCKTIKLPARVTEQVCDRTTRLGVFVLFIGVEKNKKHSLAELSTAAHRPLTTTKQPTTTNTQPLGVCRLRAKASTSSLRFHNYALARSAPPAAVTSLGGASLCRCLFQKTTPHGPGSRVGRRTGPNMFEARGVAFVLLDVACLVLGTCPNACVYHYYYYY